jgi:maleylacetate reductase
MWGSRDVRGGDDAHPVAVTQAALSQLQAAECDSLVAIGGGSTIGLSKALALRTDLPQVAVPTT